MGATEGGGGAECCTPPGGRAQIQGAAEGLTPHRATAVWREHEPGQVALE